MSRDEIALSTRASAGDRVEARVAQVWFWEGYYAKRGIDVQSKFGGDITQITDLDLLAFDITPSLGRTKIIGESKSGTGKSAPKALDRMIWQRGLAEFVAADQAELTINTTVSEQSRRFGKQLGVTIQSLQDLERREEALFITNVQEAGSHGVSAFELASTVRQTCKSEPELEIAYRFLRSEVWFLDSFIALKQTMSTIELLSRQWVAALEDAHKQAIRWMLAESLSIFTLCLIDIAGEARLRSKPEFEAFVASRLGDGVVSSSEMAVLSASIDRYISGLLVAANASTEIKANAIGAFEPVAPGYATSLAELAWRMSRWVRAADFPRQMDFLAHERIARNRVVPHEPSNRLQLHTNSVHTSVAVVTAFLRAHASLPSDVSAALQPNSKTAPLENAPLPGL